MGNPIGMVFELSPTNKLPQVALKSVFGVSATGAAQIRYLLLVGACASGGGTLTANTQVKELVNPGDEEALTGGTGNELWRMVQMARRADPYAKIKIATVSQSSTAAATATVTFGGSWTAASSGPLLYRIGGCPIQVSILSTDTATTAGDALVAAITATPACPVTASNNAGEVTLTAKSYGTRGNDLIVWQDVSLKPSGLTSTLAGGASVASGGVRFTGGTATEDVSTLFNTTLDMESFWTGAAAIIDATNLARMETALDTRCGPTKRRFANLVFGSTKAFASSTSLAQTTLDNVRTMMLDDEEGETPGEEQAAFVAALRNAMEQENPNTKFDFWPVPFVPQEAASKRKSETRQIAALDVGLTPVVTYNGAVTIPRFITTRSLNSAGAADDGTIDVGQARTPDVINEEIGALWQGYTDALDPRAHHHLRNNPAPGEEADIPAGVTYPKDWQQQVQAYMKGREAAGWVTEVDSHPTVVNMHPTASTPRFVQYTPVIVAPQTHQLEGTIAQTKFVAT